VIIDGFGVKALPGRWLRVPMRIDVPVRELMHHGSVMFTGQ
jgi:hypothetical protein